MPVSTPCRNVCVLDHAAGICGGCGRTLAEIGAWAGLSEPQRQAIMARLPERLASAYDPREGPAVPPRAGPVQPC